MLRIVAESIFRTGQSTLELRVEGAPGTVSLRSFLDVLTAALAVLRDLDSAISAVPKGTLDWYVTDLHSSDLIATVEQRPRSDRAADNGPMVATIFLRGLDELQHEATIPPYFSLDSLRNVGKIAGIVGRNGATGFSARAVGIDVAASINREASPHVTTVLAPRYRAHGSITGRLEMISLHRGRTFNLYVPRTHRAIRCSFPATLFEDARNALGKTVVATGVVERNANGDAIKLLADDLRPWPLAPVLPSIDDIYGSDPDLTGDKTSEDFLAEVRGR